MLRKIGIVVFVLAILSFSPSPLIADEKKGMKAIAANLYATDAFEYWQSWNRGAKEAAKALGLEYIQFSEDFKGTEKSVANTEDAIAHGAKLLTFVCSNEGAIIPVTKICNEKRVYLVNTWNNIPWFTPLDAGKYYVAFFTPNNVELGATSAEALFKALGGRGNIVEIAGFPGSGSAEDRSLGVKIAMKKYPGIRLLDSQPSYYRRDQARKVMEDFLVAHPKIDGIVACNDDSALGAIGAFKERGMKIPKIVGADGIKEGLEAIKTGEMTATFVNFPEWQGGYGMVVLFDVLNGWYPSVPERMMCTGGKVLDKTNVDRYYSKIIGAKTTPFDWRKMSKVLNARDWDLQVEMRPMNPNDIWKHFKKPAEYRLPSEVLEAWAKGEPGRVESLYKEHTKNLIVK